MRSDAPMVVTVGQERRRRRVIMLVGVSLVLGALGALGLLRVMGGLEDRIVRQNREIARNQQQISSLTREVRDLCADKPQPCPAVIVQPSVIITVPSATTAPPVTTLHTVPSDAAVRPASTTSTSSPRTTSSTTSPPASTTSSSSSSTVPQCSLPLPSLCGLGSPRAQQHRP